MGPLSHSKQRCLQPTRGYLSLYNGTTVPEQADIPQETYSHSPQAGRGDAAPLYSIKGGPCTASAKTVGTIVGQL